MYRSFGTLEVIRKIGCYEPYFLPFPAKLGCCHVGVVDGYVGRVCETTAVLCLLPTGVDKVLCQSCNGPILAGLRL